MKKIITVVFIFLASICLGQRKYTADKYFEDFAYKKSAELYEKIYNKGDESYEILSKLGDSYYFNSEFTNAEKWYATLMSKYEGQVASEYFFRYAQSLKSNGKIKESDKWLLKFSKINRNDSRGKALKENENYFSDYTKSEKKVFVNIKNLSLNTKYSDFGGFIYQNLFYFASTKPIGEKDKIYNWNKQPHLNIYKAEELFDDENQTVDLTNEERVQSISSKYHESNAVITSDGKTMYFTRTSFDGEKLIGGTNEVANLKIYKAENINGKWEHIRKLPFNNDNYSVGHPALSLDEKTLYFISDMPNGFGLTDIYKVSILENDTYSTPENLGAEINTEGREMFPFVTKDKTLYFASDGHLGLGALDVFESKMQDKTYTNPKNLGVPINSSYDDFAFVIDREKNSGFFSSNRKGGKGDDDIYSFMLYKCKEDITGIVSDESNENPIQGAVVKLIDSEGKVVAKKVTGENGNYTFIEVECEKDFVVVAEQDDYKSSMEKIRISKNDKIKVSKNLTLKPLIVGGQIVINPIYFDFGKFNIRDDAAHELEHVVTVMENHPEMVIKIESHTDSRGKRAYNKFLSDKRAKATRNYIISRGIRANRIESALGYGEEQLLNDCNDANQRKCTEEEHQKNRRSYFYITKGEGVIAINSDADELHDKLTNEEDKDKNEKINNRLLYRVQVGISSSPNKKNLFPNLDNLEVIRIGRYYKYFCCVSTSYEKAKEVRNKVKKIGYKDAYIVPFFDGKKIDIKEALLRNE
ncbi:OmpA family protein [Tenacibaculum sediminilitoris]|uniref:OmpA family protein n=1 Tax=Tenacibaculum sediminilitoris TaxID=1820334 RepID=UPI0038B4A667